MSAARALKHWLRDCRAATGAEFAIVLPLALVFLLGIIDAGRYMYTFNQAQKAVQVGARWAAVTDIIVTDLITYSYVIDGGLTQGDPVGTDDFPGAECSSDGSAVSCECPQGGTCDYDVSTVNEVAFRDMVGRMEQIFPGLEEQDVSLDYTNSGLGYAGDPTGPDVAPFVTVSIEGMSFTPTSLMIFGATVPLPDFSYTLTMEDGQGTTSN